MFEAHTKEDVEQYNEGNGIPNPNVLQFDWPCGRTSSVSVRISPVLTVLTSVEEHFSCPDSS